MPSPGRIQAARVTFEAGAHTRWHRHPLGQTLLVTAGRGFVQARDTPPQEIHVGDVVVCPPDEVHWHGAAPDSQMTHIAIQEALDGKPVEWLDPLTKQDYAAATGGTVAR
jgi:quercetin dioxygenase-like cupin family protein